jgi:tripartite-type tricarboxylate transporter receptor subunit TctC
MSIMANLARAVFLSLAVCAAAYAQSFPDKSVRIVVPTPPGGVIDVWARVLAQKLTVLWGQQVFVDNRRGGNFVIGTNLVAKSAPDGYTLLMTSNTHAANTTLLKNLPYDSVKDFIPVTLVNSGYLALVAHPSVPVSSVGELVALAKARPGQLNFAIGASGGASNAASQLFKLMTDTDIATIPYASNPPALVDVLAGQVQLMFESPHVVLPQLRTGKLKALAVTSSKRLAAMPDVPTLAEAGVPGYELSLWVGMFAPAGTPPDIVKKIALDIATVLAMPDVVDTARAQAMELIGSSPAQFSTHLAREITKWGRIIREAQIKAD